MYGPVRTVVWEGRSRKAPPIPINLIYGMALSRDGRWVLSGGDDKTVRLWDVATGKELLRFEKHTQGVRSVALSPDGSLAASGSEDRTVRLWKLPKRAG